MNSYKRKSISKRIISLILSIFMVISTVIPSNMTVFAAETATTTDADIEVVVFDHMYSDVDVSNIKTTDLFVMTQSSEIFTKNTNIISNYDDVYIISCSSIEEAQYVYSYYVDKVDFISDLSDTINVADDTENDNPEDIADLSNINESDDAISNLNTAIDNAAEDKTDYSDYIALIDSGADADVMLSVIGDNPNDTLGHGTAMYNYIKEENPNAKIISIKAFENNGANVADIYAAIKLAIEYKVSTINLSFTGLNIESNKPINDVIQEAIDNGITVIGAAGNYKTDAKKFIPGCIEDVITVGAVNDNGTLYEKSNYNADLYVVATSTSEATARYTGIYSSKKESNKVFKELVNLNGEEQEEEQDVENGNTFDEDLNEVQNYITNHNVAENKYLHISIAFTDKEDVDSLYDLLYIRTKDHIGSQTYDIPLYDYNDEYYCANISNYVDVSSIFDYDFALYNLNGLTYKNAEFNEKTGEILVSKKAYNNEIADDDVYRAFSFDDQVITEEDKKLFKEDTAILFECASVKKENTIDVLVIDNLKNENHTISKTLNFNEGAIYIPKQEISDSDIDISNTNIIINGEIIPESQINYNQLDELEIFTVTSSIRDMKIVIGDINGEEKDFILQNWDYTKATRQYGSPSHPAFTVTDDGVDNWEPIINGSVTNFGVSIGYAGSSATPSQTYYDLINAENGYVSANGPIDFLLWLWSDDGTEYFDVESFSKVNNNFSKKVTSSFWWDMGDRIGVYDEGTWWGRATEVYLACTHGTLSNHFSISGSAADVQITSVDEEHQRIWCYAQSTTVTTQKAEGTFFVEYPGTFSIKLKKSVVESNGSTSTNINKVGATATFKLTGPNNYSKTIKFDSNMTHDYIKISKLKPGKYTLTETSNTGYLYKFNSSGSITLNLDRSNDGDTFEIKEHYEPLQLSLSKKDANNNIALDNTYFAVFYETNNNGKQPLHYGNLTQDGTYTIDSVKIPNMKYKANDNFVILKTDASGNAIAGTLDSSGTYSSGNNFIFIPGNDKNGKVKVNGTYETKFWVVELPRTGYIVPGTDYFTNLGIGNINSINAATSAARALANNQNVLNSIIATQKNAQDSTFLQVENNIETGKNNSLLYNNATSVYNYDITQLQITKTIGNNVSTNGNIPVSGARYQIYYDAACTQPVQYNPTLYNKITGKQLNASGNVILTTDANGNAKTAPLIFGRGEVGKVSTNGGIGTNKIYYLFAKEIPPTNTKSKAYYSEINPEVFVFKAKSLDITPASMSTYFIPAGRYYKNRYYNINDYGLNTASSLQTLPTSKSSYNTITEYADDWVKVQIGFNKKDGNLLDGSNKQNKTVSGATYVVYEDAACTKPVKYNYPSYIKNATDYAIISENATNANEINAVSKYYKNKNTTVSIFVDYNNNQARTGMFYPSAEKLAESPCKDGVYTLTYYVKEQHKAIVAAFRDIQGISESNKGINLKKINPKSLPYTATSSSKEVINDVKDYGYTRVAIRKVDGNLFQNYNNITPWDNGKKVLGVQGAEYTLYYYNQNTNQYTPVTYNYPSYITDATSYVKYTGDNAANYHNKNDVVKFVTDSDGYAYSDIFYPTSDMQMKVNNTPQVVSSGAHKNDPIFTFFAKETNRTKDTASYIYEISPKMYRTEATYLHLYNDNNASEIDVNNYGNNNFNSNLGEIYSGKSAATIEQWTKDVLKRENVSYYLLTETNYNYPNSRVITDNNLAGTYANTGDKYTYIKASQNTNVNDKAQDYGRVGLRIEKLNGNIYDKNSKSIEKLWVDGAIYTVYDSYNAAKAKDSSHAVKYNYPDYITSADAKYSDGIYKFVYPSDSNISNTNNAINRANAYLYYSSNAKDPNNYLNSNVAKVNGEIDDVYKINNMYTKASEQGYKYHFVKDNNGNYVLAHEANATVQMTTISNVSNNKEENSSTLSFSGWFYPGNNAEVEMRDSGKGYKTPYFTYYIRETDRIAGSEASYQDINPCIYKVVCTYSDVVEITECNNVTLGSLTGEDNQYYTPALDDTTAVQDFGWMQAKIQKRDKITLNPLSGAEYTLYYFKASTEGDDLIIKDGQSGRFVEVTYNYPDYITSANDNTNNGKGKDPVTMYGIANEGGRSTVHNSTDVVKMTTNSTGWAISDPFYPSYDAEHEIKRVDVDGDGVYDKTLVYFTYYVKETITPRNYYNEQNIPSIQFFNSDSPLTIIHELVQTTYCYDKSNTALNKNRSTYPNSTKEVVDMYGNRTTIYTHQLGTDWLDAQQIAESFIDGNYNANAITNNGMAVANGRIYNADGDKLEDVYDYNELYQNNIYRSDEYDPIYESEDFPVRGWAELYKEDSYLKKYSLYQFLDLHAKENGNTEDDDKIVLGHNGDIETTAISSGSADFAGSRYQLVAADTIRHPDGKTTGAQMYVSSQTEEGVIYKSSNNLADCDPIKTSKIVGYNTDSTGRELSPIYEQSNKTGIYATNSQGYLQIGSSDENEWDADDLWPGTYYLYEIPSQVIVSKANASRYDTRAYLLNGNGYNIDNSVYKVTVTYKDSNTKKVKATVEKCNFTSGIVYDANSSSKWRVTGTVSNGTSKIFTNDTNVVADGPNGEQGNDTILLSTEQPITQKFTFYKAKMEHSDEATLEKLGGIHFYVKNRLDLGRYVVTNIHGQPLDKNGNITTDPSKYVVNYKIDGTFNNYGYDVVYDYYSLDRSLRTDGEKDSKGNSYESTGEYFKYGGNGLREYSNVEIGADGKAVVLNQSNEYKEEYLMEISEILLNQYPNLVIDGITTKEVSTQKGANMDVTRVVTAIDMKAIGYVNVEQEISGQNKINNPMANAKILIDDDGNYHLGLPMYDYGDNYSPNDDVNIDTYDVVASDKQYGQFEYWSDAINYGEQMKTTSPSPIYSTTGQQIYVDKDDLKDEYLNLNNSKFTDEEISDATAKSKANNNSLEGTLSFTSKAEHDSATQTITKPESDNDDQRFGFFESIPLPYGVYAVEESVTDALNITDGFGLVDSTIAAPTFDVAINAKTIKDYGAYETEYTINADGSMFGNIPLIVVGDQPESKGIRITKKDAFTGKSVLKPNTTYKIYKVEGSYEQGQEIKKLNLVTYTTKEDGEPIRHDTWITGENGTCEAFGVEDYENFGSGTYLIVELQGPGDYYVSKNSFKFASQNAFAEAGELLKPENERYSQVDDDRLTDYYGITDGLGETIDDPEIINKLTEYGELCTFNVDSSTHASTVQKVEEYTGISLEFVDYNKPQRGVIEVIKKGPFLTGYNASNYTKKLNNVVEDYNGNPITVESYEGLPLHTAPAWLTFTYEEQYLPNATFEIYTTEPVYSEDHQYKYEEIKNAHPDWEITYRRLNGQGDDYETITNKYSDYDDDLEKFEYDFLRYGLNKLTDEQRADIEQYRTYATYINQKGETVTLDKAGVLVDTLTTLYNDTEYYDVLTEQYVTVKRGTALSNYLPLGTTYKVVETKAPVGYVLQEAEENRTQMVTFEKLENDNTPEVKKSAEFENDRQRYKFYIKKYVDPRFTNNKLNTKVENASFTLYNSKLIRASEDKNDPEYNNIIFPSEETYDNPRICDELETIIKELIARNVKKTYGSEEEWNNLSQEEIDALVEEATSEWNSYSATEKGELLNKYIDGDEVSAKYTLDEEAEQRVANALGCYYEEAIETQKTQITDSPNEVTFMAADENGDSTIPYGVYHAHEDYPTPGFYSLPDDEQHAIIFEHNWTEENSTQKLIELEQTVINYPTTVSFVKRDFNTNKLLSGATLEILDPVVDENGEYVIDEETGLIKTNPVPHLEWNEETQKLEWVDNTEWVTDKDETFTWEYDNKKYQGHEVKGLAVNHTYILREKVNIPGYASWADSSDECKEANEFDTVYNEKFFTVNDADFENGVILNDIQEITAYNEQERFDFTIIKRGTSIVDVLNAIENNPLDGTANTTTDDDGNPVVAPFDTDDVINSIIYKRFSLDKISLAGCEFDIIATEDGVLPSGRTMPNGSSEYKEGDVLETLTTDELGYAVSSLYLSGNYKVKETYAPKPFGTVQFIVQLNSTKVKKNYEYTYDQNIYHVNIPVDDIQVLDEVEVSKMPDIEYINKYRNPDDEEYTLDNFTENYMKKYNLSIAGAKYGLFAGCDIYTLKDGEYVKIMDKDELVEVATIDEDGSALFMSEIPTAVYTMKDGQIISIDSDFYVKEIEAPLGWYLDPNKYHSNAVYNKQARQYYDFDDVDFEVYNDYLDETNKYIDEFQMTSLEVPVIVEINKLLQKSVLASDATDEEKENAVETTDEFIYLNTDTFVKGAKLQIKDKDGNIVDSWVTTEDAPHYTYCLHVGEEYTLEEVETPKGYVTAEPVKFTVDDTCTVEVEDDNNEIINNETDDSTNNTDNEVTTINPYAFKFVTEDGETLNDFDDVEFELYATNNGQTELIDTITNNDSIFTITMSDDYSNYKLKGLENTNYEDLTITLNENNIIIDWPSQEFNNVQKYFFNKNLVDDVMNIIFNNESDEIINEEEMTEVDYTNAIEETYRFVDKEDQALFEQFNNATFKVYATNINSNKSEWIDTITAIEDKVTIKTVEDYTNYTLIGVKTKNGIDISDLSIQIDYKAIENSEEQKLVEFIDWPTAGWKNEEFDIVNSKLIVPAFDLSKVTATDNKISVEIPSVKMYDRLTVLKISKLDITNMKELPGATLQIIDKNGDIYEEWVSTDKPHYIYGIPTGKYTLRERITPDCFTKAEDIEFEIEDKKVVQTVEMKDKPTVLDITKLDITNSKELPGATLQIIDKDNNVVYEWVSTDTPHRIIGIKHGKYTLREISTPSGFATAEDIIFEITDKAVVNKVNMKDKPLELHVSKVEITGGPELPGAKLQILDETGEKVLYEWISTDTPHVIKYIPTGKYILREITAPDGHLKAEDIKFTIKDTNEVQGVEMIDEYTKLNIKKTDLTTGKELPGATLQIIDKDGKVYEEWVSTEEEHVVERIPIGKYTLREITAPDGYLKAEDIEFEITATSEVQKVEMKDDYTKLHISKQDLTTKKELPGAKLQILDENGKVYEEWTSTNEQHVIERIPVGKYKLVETTAPEGYEVAETIEFEVKATGEIQTVVMYDKYKPTTPETPKTGDNKRFPWEYLLIAFVCLGTAGFAINKKKKSKKINNDSNESN